MAGSVNKHILVGNVGKDPEILTTTTGKKVAKFSLATSRTWRDKTSGERNENTNWHNIVIFNEPLVEVVERFVKKGMKLYIEGSVETRKWQDKEGNDRWSTETVLRPFASALQMVEGKGGGHAPEEDDYGTTKTREGGGHTPRGSTDLDDDIPFAPEWR